MSMPGNEGIIDSSRLLLLVLKIVPIHAALWNRAAVSTLVLTKEFMICVTFPVSGLEPQIVSEDPKQFPVKRKNGYPWEKRLP